MTASFGLLARRWVAGRLAATPVIAALPGGVWEHPGPAGAYPVVTFDIAAPFLATADVSGATVFATGQVRVRVCGATENYDDVSGVYDALVAALDMQTNSPIGADALVLTSRFRSGFEQAEDSPSRHFRTLGAVFEVRIQTTS